MATFSGEIEDEVKAGKEDFETTMKEFKDDVQEILGLAKKEKEKGKGKDAKLATKTEKAKQPTLEKFNTTVKKQFLQWLEFQKALEETQGNPAIAQKAKDQIQEVKAQLEVEAENAADGDEDATKLPDQESEEQAEKEAETPARASRLSRLSGNKGKWFS